LGRLNGFTLLELMVVLVIMVLVYTLTIPAISTLIPGVELKGATRQISAGLRKARSRAVTIKQESTLTLDVEQRKFSISGDEKIYDIPSGLDLNLITARSEQLGPDVGAIRFYPDGSSTGGSITLASGELEYIVDVNWLTGQVNVANEFQ
jgi:general secretion pathway protein H